MYSLIAKERLNRDMKISRMVILLIMLSSAQSAIAYPASYDHIKSTELNPAHAEDDAIKDANSGNCKLYAIQGYSLDIPDQPSNSDGYKIVVVDDTSDAWTSEADREATRVASIYAKAYNRVAVAICSQSR
jgi:hypothetical protein